MNYGTLTPNKLLILVTKTVLGYTLFVIVLFIIPIYQQAKTVFGDFVDDVYSNRIVVGETALIVKIADTEEARIAGLSNVPELKPKNGVFFKFETNDFHGIWMKDMNFAIDVIWIDKDYQVVHIEKNVSPDTYPTVFKPKTKSMYVLETNAGFVEKNGIKIGDIVTLL